MRVRVKDIWMVKAAFDRIIQQDKMPVKQAALLAEAAEPLWDAHQIYQIERKRKYDSLGLNKPEDQKAPDREEREQQFNDWAAEAAEEEVAVSGPVHVNKIPNANITALQVMALKRIGLLSTQTRWERLKDYFSGR